MDPSPGTDAARPAPRSAARPGGGRVVFHEAEHAYVTDTGQVLTSVTQLVGRFFPVFAAEAQARRCAQRGQRGEPGYRYNGMDEAGILAQWEAEGERGRREGQVVHRYAECLIRGVAFDIGADRISARCRQLFRRVDEALRRLQRHYELLEPEQILFDPDLGLAGTVDLPLRCRRSGALVIADWKQSKRIEFSSPWGRAHPPLGHLQDCEGHRYGLQLSLYERLYRNGGYYPEVSGYRRGLIHLTETQAHMLPMPCHAADVDRVLGVWQAAPRAAVAD